METELKNYKTATWILVLVVVVLGILLIVASDKEAVSSIEDTQTVVEKCKTNIAKWREENPNIGKASPEAQADLSLILESCSLDIGDTKPEEDAS